MWDSKPVTIIIIIIIIIIMLWLEMKGFHNTLIACWQVGQCLSHCLALPVPPLPGPAFAAVTLLI